MQPLPVPTSATRSGTCESRARSTARCTSTSVSGFGTSTSGVTSKSRPMNSLWPTRYATGSPLAPRDEGSISAELALGQLMIELQVQVEPPQLQRVSEQELGVEARGVGSVLLDVVGGELEDLDDR